jgi:hypothetical protein
MIRLIGSQSLRIGKGDDDDPDTAPLELIFECLHLAEMMLARKSGKVPEKN